MDILDRILNRGIKYNKRNNFIRMACKFVNRLYLKKNLKINLNLCLILKYGHYI
jgi:hypothetical protein